MPLIPPRASCGCAGVANAVCRVRDAGVAVSSAAPRMTFSTAPLTGTTRWPSLSWMDLGDRRPLQAQARHQSIRVEDERVHILPDGRVGPKFPAVTPLEEP